MKNDNSHETLLPPQTSICNPIKSDKTQLNSNLIWLDPTKTC